MFTCQGTIALWHISINCRFCTCTRWPSFTCHYPKISQLRSYVIHPTIYQRSMEIYRHYYYRHHCTYHWSILDYKLLRIYSRVSKFNHAPHNKNAKLGTIFNFTTRYLFFHCLCTYICAITIYFIFSRASYCPFVLGPIFDKACH